MEELKDIYGKFNGMKVVVGVEYKGYYANIENSEYVLKDKNGKTIFTTGLKYELKNKINELINKNESEEN